MNLRRLFEADPMAADAQIDFEQQLADPSRYTIGHNIHPASEMDQQPGDGASYDGAMVPGAGGDMMGQPGQGMPGQPPTDDQLQPIEPGMQPPGQPPNPPQMEGRDLLDLYLDILLSESTELITIRPFC